MHYYSFNIADWALHTSHLTVEEEGVFRRLIDHYYDTESPIPKKTQPVIRRLRLVSHESIVQSILEEFFTLLDDGWHNLRADIEIKSYHDKAAKARSNGRKGGRPKKNKGLETQSVILANPEITGSKANYKLLTNNQELLTNKNTLVETKVSTCPHMEIINIYHECLPTLPRVAITRWSGSSREKQLQARWREDKRHQDLDFWKRFFEAIRSMPFYLGENDRQWRADLGWLVKRENFDKMIDKAVNQ